MSHVSDNVRGPIVITPFVSFWTRSTSNERSFLLSKVSVYVWIHPYVSFVFTVHHPRFFTSLWQFTLLQLLLPKQLLLPSFKFLNSFEDSVMVNLPDDRVHVSDRQDREYRVPKTPWCEDCRGGDVDLVRLSVSFPPPTRVIRTVPGSVPEFPNFLPGKSTRTIRGLRRPRRNDILPRHY